MIDTHAHIDTEAFDEDRLEIIQEAFDNGVEAIIIPAIEPKDFNRVLHASSLSEKIFCSMGVHPHNASEVTSGILQKVEEITTSHSDVVAIGEIGLDYHYDFNPADIQKKAFLNQIYLAKNLDLPIIVHNRESDIDMMKILKQEQNGNLRGVLHCFSGDMEMLERAIDLGFHVSFTGNITFKKSKLDEIVKSTPLDRIMLETDSPYMTPVPFRGKRNKPSYVNLVAEKIANIKSINLEEVLNMTTQNAKRLFNVLGFLLMLTFLHSTLYAQNEEFYDEYDEEYIEDSLDVEEVLYNPYKKHLGFGFSVGSNVIIQTYNPGNDERSQDGLLAYGGGVNYFLNDYFSIAGSYFYAKNSKISEEADWGLDPNHHHMGRTNVYVYSTPYNIINIFATAGASYSYNKISTGFDEVLETSMVEIDKSFGVNLGLGFQANFDAGDAGIFAFSAEWVVDFIFGKTELDHDYRFDPDTDEYYNPVEISNFYSLVQVRMYWYPKMFGN